MLDKLKYEDYVTELNTKFALAETPMEIELIEVTQRNLSPQQEIFSLIFSGAKDNFLEQKIYRMRHEKLGEGDLFLVPIAEKQDGYHYEAGFNRIID
jgi:hypothetical protein